MYNLKQDLGKNIGNYNGLPVYVVSKSTYQFNRDVYQIIVETGEVVLRNSVVAKMTGRREICDLTKPRPFSLPRVEKKPDLEPVPKEEVKVEIPDPVIADVQINDLINETLRGMTLDDLLCGFNYGL